MVLSMRGAIRNSYVLVMTVTIERERLLANTPVTERRIELAGLSTAVLEAGAGPPMVLAPPVLVPVSVGTAAAARYGWPIRVLDNTGNEPALEDPEAFVKAVTS
jgi:hypothetical protein